MSVKKEPSGRRSVRVEVEVRGTPEDAPYSYALAVPTDAPGLRFLCRESFDLGRSAFDHPFGSRYDEIVDTFSPLKTRGASALTDVVPLTAGTLVFTSLNGPSLVSAQ